MSMKPDIEDLLKRFRREPSPRVKRAVLAKYTERYGPERWTSAASFWRRSVPLSLAAALIIIVAGLSFLAGRADSHRGSRAGGSTLSARDSLADSVSWRQWYYAPNDLF